jgi:hypothetical protein
MHSLGCFQIRLYGFKTMKKKSYSKKLNTNAKS